MTFLDIFLDEHESYESLLSDLGKLSASAKKDLLANLPYIEADNPTYFLHIIEYYVCLSLFPDKEVLSSFEKLGISDDHLQWFIPLNDIDTELEILVNKYHTINNKVSVLKRVLY